METKEGEPVFYLYVIFGILIIAYGITWIIKTFHLGLP
jgi:hypothetical protein